jgi:aspartate-semialdehyde dehydrogenase
MSPSKKLHLAIVGTESLRSKEIRNILDTKKFPVKNVEFYDPGVEEEYSKLTQFRGEPKVVHHLDDKSLYGSDIVFLVADAKVNLRFGKYAQEKKFHAIDLDGTFNKKKDVPLVVAGVNDGIIKKKIPDLIANPHPVTIILSHLFHLVMEEFGLSRTVSFILQPVSAFQDAGIDELVQQSVALLNGTSIPKKVFKDQIAFNLLSHTEKPNKDGFCSLEKEIIYELRRVFEDRSFPLTLSLVQAPVFHSYSIMSFLELRRRADLQGMENLFKQSQFFKSHPLEPSCPVSALSVAGKEEIFVGLIKKDRSFSRGFWVWTVADNLIRGSALNAFEIAEMMVSSSSQK